MIDHFAVARRIHVAVNVHNGVRSGWLLAATGDVLSGSGIQMLQAVYRAAVQVMGRSVNRAFTGQRGNLFVLAVFAGTAIYTCLAYSEAPHGAMDIFQRETVHGAGTVCTDHSCGTCCKSIVCNSQSLCIRGLRFLCQHIHQPFRRPFQRSICVIVPVQVTHTIPSAAFCILRYDIHLHHGILHENTESKGSQRIIYAKKYASAGRDGYKIASLRRKRGWRSVNRFFGCFNFDRRYGFILRCWSGLLRWC